MWDVGEFEFLTRDGPSELTGSTFLRDVARGNVDGSRAFTTRGRVTTSGSDSGVLWPGGTYAIPPAVGASISFISTSAQDGPGGTGIRSIDVHYLDTNLDEQNQIVELNGTTEVSDEITGVRFIQYMRMITYGTGKGAAGNISAYTGSDVYEYIEAGARITASSVTMVPRNKRILLYFAAAGAASGTAAAQAIVQIGTPNCIGHDYSADNIFIPVMELTFQDNSFGAKFPIPLVCNEGEMVGMLFEVDKAATITGTLQGVIENA